jgi:sialidase-1
VSNPELLRRFDDRQRNVEGMGYRGKKGFRWPYLDEFPEWRKKMNKGVTSMALAAGLAASTVAAVSPESSTVFQRGERYGYRIPAVVVSQKGTIMAFAERRIGLHDHAQNDIVLRRSSDGGRSWGPEQVLKDDGGDSLNDPCAAVLASSRILLRYTRFPQGYHARKSGHTEVAETGYGGPRNVRLYLMRSEDDGATWSAPVDLTRQMRPEQSVSVGSPGNAIQLTRGTKQGRIVFPQYETYYIGGKRMWKTRVCFSDDGGASWQLGKYISEGDLAGYGNEAQVVELADGGVLFSARNQGGGLRKLAVSRDAGESWSPYRLQQELVTPACMASVVRYSWPEDDKPGVLLHSIPFSKKGRENGAVLVSYDDGTTWPVSSVIEPGAFAYSCLAVLKDGSVGCLYEGGGYRDIRFARFPLSSLSRKSAALMGFEDAAPGPFTRLQTPVGTWMAEEGHAQIDSAHADLGKRCLHIRGGRNNAVELELASAAGNAVTLSLKAERWTRRDPFVFRVAGRDNRRWQELYNGDEVIKIGGFHTEVRLELPPGTGRLRFSCTAPDGSGVLLDDVRIQ